MVVHDDDSCITCQLSVAQLFFLQICHKCILFFGLPKLNGMMVREKKLLYATVDKY
jgi:hypothetical protein